MRPLHYEVFDAVDASIDETGATIDSSFLWSVSGQATVTGTSTGTLKFQASNDVVTASPFEPTNWTDISGKTVSIAGAGVYLIPKFDISYQHIRAVYLKNNGASGTITVDIKALGA